MKFVFLFLKLVLENVLIKPKSVIGFQPLEEHTDVIKNTKFRGKRFFFYHSVTICTHVNTQKELHNQTLLLIPSIPCGLTLDLNHTLILTLTSCIER